MVIKEIIIFHQNTSGLKMIIQNTYKYPGLYFEERPDQLTTICDEYTHCQILNM